MENSKNQVDRSSVPEWNFTILMNDFDDDYWDDDFERYNPEAFYALSNLNRKCNTIEMYEEQKEIYEKYLPEAEKFYGGPLAIEFLRKEFGNVKGLPRPPKLQGKLMKKYVEGAYYQLGKYIPKIDSSVIKEAEREQLKGVDFSNVKFVPPDEPKEVLRKTAKLIADSKLTGNHKASSVSFSTDIISQIAENVDVIANNPFMDIDKALFSNLSTLSLAEHERLYDEREEAEKLAAEREELSSSEDISYGSTIGNYRNRLRSSIYVYKSLEKAGQKPFADEQLAEMSQGRKDLLANYLGAEAVLTPKELKKLKKKRKKEMKQYEEQYSRHQSETNRALSNILSSQSILSKIKYYD